ncbi:4390_t:CDS:2 [Entrophospora sp. SA101]|nr:5139_t:CDS:2 [Entrophospora sp. SA101]CAJ0900143.1 4390_t:CDS:2 [Entrophospora sp. SA101]
MLKSSILQFKNDFQKQAKLIKLSQEISKSSPMIKQGSPENSTIGSISYLQKRIKELEAENEKEESAIKRKNKQLETSAINSNLN